VTDTSVENSGRLATAVVISRIRWAFIPLAIVGVLTNVPPPVNQNLFLATIVFLAAYNLALTVHSRLPRGLVQPLILVAMAGDVLLVGVTMFEFASDPADLGWGFLMLVGPAAAVLYGWRGLLWFGPPMIAALFVATLSGGQFATSNGAVGFLHKMLEVVGITVIVAFLAERNARQRSSLEKANQKLEELTLSDPLTGIANRRHFELRWEQEQVRSLRTDLPVSVVIADIDHFKLINDKYGHPAGDSVLRSVATALRSRTRNNDLVARIGGEEFAFVLPNTDDDGARVFGESIRKVVSELNFSGLQASCTISVGIASSARAPLSDLLVGADRALYRAKTTGRNRIEAWRGEVRPAA
jgi:diguanylate cyclase (GGDEF)-like protein